MIYHFRDCEYKEVFEQNQYPVLDHVSRLELKSGQSYQAMHSHKDRVEIIYILEGEGRHTIGSSTYDTQGIVTLYRPDTNNYTWHGIVYPKGTSTDITVNVTYKNVTYKTTLSGCTLTAGSQYEYTLTIQNNILVPVGSEIKPWTPNQTHTGSLS